MTWTFATMLISGRLYILANYKICTYKLPVRRLFSALKKWIFFINNSLFHIFSQKYLFLSFGLYSICCFKAVALNNLKTEKIIFEENVKTFVLPFYCTILLKHFFRHFISFIQPLKNLPVPIEIFLELSTLFSIIVEY